ncbi:hypothetical protein [Elizabethkingia meningoseptica]|uniref:hypothetical protein n=1 Tax=Elizabethkingia meningoseptica TaxID=238 RepID=UPI0038914ED2
MKKLIFVLILLLNGVWLNAQTKQETLNWLDQEFKIGEASYNSYSLELDRNGIIYNVDDYSNGYREVKSISQSWDSIIDVEYPAYYSTMTITYKNGKRYEIQFNEAIRYRFNRIWKAIIHLAELDGAKFQNNNLFK